MQRSGEQRGVNNEMLCAVLIDRARAETTGNNLTLASLKRELLAGAKVTKSTDF